MGLFANHAGTSHPKADGVIDAVTEVSAMSPMEQAPRGVADAETIAAAFGVKSPLDSSTDTQTHSHSLVITSGCTSAIDLAVWSLPWSPGDVVITSAVEHEALARPLSRLSARCGVKVIAHSPPLSLDTLEQTLRENPCVKLVAVSHISNVTQDALLSRQQLTQVAGKIHASGALLLVDGAQAVGNCPGCGTVPVECDVDLYCFGAHKGIRAVMGVGGLIVSTRARAIAESSLGNRSAIMGSKSAGDLGFCDAGSLNYSALAGFAAAVRTNILETGNSSGIAQAAHLAQLLHSVDGVELYGWAAGESGEVLASCEHGPGLAFNLAGVDPVVVATRLRDEHGVVVGGGMHCAPSAHTLYGTHGRGGAVRVSFGHNVNVQAAVVVADAVKAIAATKKAVLKCTRDRGCE